MAKQSLKITKFSIFFIFWKIKFRELTKTRQDKKENNARSK